MEDEDGPGEVAWANKVSACKFASSHTSADGLTGAAAVAARSISSSSSPCLVRSALSPPLALANGEEDDATGKSNGASLDGAPIAAADECSPLAGACCSSSAALRQGKRNLGAQKCTFHPVRKANNDIISQEKKP